MNLLDNRRFKYAALIFAPFGLLGLGFGPAIIDRMADRMISAEARGGDPFHVANSSVDFFRDVKGAFGTTAKPAGRLEIIYPSELRENQDGLLRVVYRAGPKWNSAGTMEGRKFSVTLLSPAFEVQPAPPRYDFDLGRVNRNMSDEKTWIISPKREGEYSLLLVVDRGTSGLRPASVAANGQQLRPGGSIPLPVKVYTRFGLRQNVIDLAKSVTSLVSFLLTGPAAALTLSFIRKRFRKTKSR